MANGIRKSCTRNKQTFSVVLGAGSRTYDNYNNWATKRAPTETKKTVNGQKIVRCEFINFINRNAALKKKSKSSKAIDTRSTRDSYTVYRPMYRIMKTVAVRLSARCIAVGGMMGGWGGGGSVGAKRRNDGTFFFSFLVRIRYFRFLFDSFSRSLCTHVSLMAYVRFICFVFFFLRCFRIADEQRKAYGERCAVAYELLLKNILKKRQTKRKQ